MKNELLFAIALRYANKGWSYEQLAEGEDLSDATEDDAAECLDYYDSIIDNGEGWAEDVFKESE